MDELLSHGASTRRPGGASRETLERILAIFADSLHLNAVEGAPTYEEMLEEAARLDSIAVLEFLTAVEKDFGVALEPAVLEFEFLRDLAGLASYIEDRIGGTCNPERDARDQSATNPNG
jgi:acyl carrier protein